MSADDRDDDTTKKMEDAFERLVEQQVRDGKLPPERIVDVRMNAMARSLLATHRLLHDLRPREEGALDRQAFLIAQCDALARSARQLLQIPAKSH